METLFYSLVIGAAIVAAVSLLVQIIGVLLFCALTLGAGVRDRWVNAAPAPGGRA